MTTEIERLKAAVDAASLLLATYAGQHLPVWAWRVWTATHREVLCDPRQVGGETDSAQRSERLDSERSPDQQFRAEYGFDAGAALLPADPSAPVQTETLPNVSVLAEHIEDPYASGRFENLGTQGLPVDVYNELLRVAADKHVSVYYLAAIYKRGHADALAENEDTDTYLWERCYACGHRLAFASDSCPQCGIRFVDGDDPPNWPEKCDCERCVEARAQEPHDR